MSDEQAIWNAVAVERRRLADELENLTDKQWATQSQCDVWTAREVAAHIVTPFETSTPRFMFTMLKHRGKFDNAIIELTARINNKFSTAEVIGKLRDNAENRWVPPKAGPEVPLSEIVVHGQDIRRVLGMETTVPEDTIRLALDGIDDLDRRSDYAARIGAPVHND